MKSKSTVVIGVGLVVGGLAGWLGSDLLASLYFLRSGQEENGWRYSTEWSLAAPPTLKAAAFAKHAMMANTADEAVYYLLFEDSSGGRQFRLHFDADEIPDVSAFWSLTMYHGELPYNLVGNPIDRFVISDRTPGIQFNNDGSLDVFLQHEAPSLDRESNWLPAPDGDFMVAIRTYWPGQAIVDGSWAPPPVELIQE